MSPYKSTEHTAAKEYICYCGRKILKGSRYRKDHYSGFHQEACHLECEPVELELPK